MSQVIKKPVLTEKTNLLRAKDIYVFQVVKQANKTWIKKHVEKYFEVKVSSVQTAVCRKRGKRVRSRSARGPVKYWKKAFVRLKEGEKITAFEGN